MIGTTLAHYRITAALGAGGMGEVWRATDTKLGRDVALKVLPEEFARDPERMARFEREAKVLASLNHPNIAHLYGLESVNTQMAAGTAAPQDSQASPEAVVGHASRGAAGTAAPQGEPGIPGSGCGARVPRSSRDGCPTRGQAGAERRLWGTRPACHPVSQAPSPKPQAPLLSSRARPKAESRDLRTKA